MTYTSLAGSPPSSLGNHEGSPQAVSADKKAQMQAQSKRRAKQLVRVESAWFVVKQASWLLPGRLYPAESWVEIEYIGDGPG